jgi:hypothetical protein
MLSRGTGKPPTAEQAQGNGILMRKIRTQIFQKITCQLLQAALRCPESRECHPTDRRTQSVWFVKGHFLTHKCTFMGYIFRV